MTCVYFIRARETGHIKIGISANPEARLARLDRAMPLSLELLAVQPVPGETRRRHAQAVEAGYHARFAADRVKGEWFCPSPGLLSLIEQIAAEQARAA